MRGLFLTVWKPLKVIPNILKVLSQAWLAIVLFLWHYFKLHFYLISAFGWGLTELTVLSFFIHFAHNSRTLESWLTGGFQYFIFTGSLTKTLAAIALIFDSLSNNCHDLWFKEYLQYASFISFSKDLSLNLLFPTLVASSSSGGFNSTSLLVCSSSVALPHAVALSQRVSLTHRGDDGDPVLRQLSQLVDELLHGAAGPGVTVQVVSQDEGALHQQLQLHQVPQPVEAQQVFLWFSAEKPERGDRMKTFTEYTVAFICRRMIRGTT